VRRGEGRRQLSGQSVVTSLVHGVINSTLVMTTTCYQQRRVTTRADSRRTNPVVCMRVKSNRKCQLMQHLSLRLELRARLADQ